MQPTIFTITGQIPFPPLHLSHLLDKKRSNISTNHLSIKVKWAWPIKLKLPPEYGPRRWRHQPRFWGITPEDMIQVSFLKDDYLIAASPSVWVSNSKNIMVLSQPRKYFKISESRQIVPQYNRPCITPGLGEASRFTNVQPNLFLEETIKVHKPPNSDHSPSHLRPLPWETPSLWSTLDITLLCNYLGCACVIRLCQSWMHPPSLDGLPTLKDCN